MTGDHYEEYCPWETFIPRRRFADRSTSMLQIIAILTVAPLLNVGC